jgi:NAD(P)-dependent dehydrogenase (short-subunit alcohol dehydrogenase family)
MGYAAMADRAAIVTGASSGIGLAIAEMLGEEGYGLTVAARRPEKLEAAAEGLAAKGYDVQQIAGNLGDEETIASVVSAHEERFGRCDVLVNNAGVGIGEVVDQLTTKKVDIQLNTNLRSIFFFYRQAMPMLRRAGEEHRNALVVNTASISGIRGEGWLSIYSATKHGVVGFTQAMNKELGGAGIKNTALCPAFVDTPMTDFVKEHVAAETMITTQDVAESVRYLLKTSPGCVIPEIRFEQPGGGLGLPE